MTKKDKIFVLVSISLLILLTIVTTIYTHLTQAEARELDRQYQIDKVLDELDNNIQEKLTREATYKQIKEERARAEQEQQELEKQKQEQQTRLEQQQQTTTYQPTHTTSTSTLTKSGGVNYYNGSRETWYSSKQLYHRNTANWTLGSDGVYRDADGYIVVARSDMAQGSVVDTSLGKGRVLDSGCAAGTTDIYTAW